MSKKQLFHQLLADSEVDGDLLDTLLDMCRDAQFRGLMRQMTAPEWESVGIQPSPPGRRWTVIIHSSNMVYHLTCQGECGDCGTGDFCHKFGEFQEGIGSCSLAARIIGGGR